VTQRVPPSRDPDLRGREWRQLKLLTRDSRKRLLDALAFARDADPMQFVLYAMALMMTLPLMMAVRRIIIYSGSAGALPGAIAPLLLADRLFFLLYSMLTAALLAALTWDALFPDRNDQEIVGVLPVRPRTLAASRFLAAAGLALGLTLAINVPAGVLYTLAQGALPNSGMLPRIMAAHVVATTLASMFVFMALMSLRGIVAICAGDRMASRLALLLQFITVVAFVEVFMFLPGILPRLARQILDGPGDYTLLPPVWFAGLYAWIAEGGAAMGALALQAAAVTAAAFAVAAAASLFPAAWMGRRALESSGRERAGSLMVLARGVATLTIRSSAIRGMFLFAIASLVRSRRHLLVLATYFGFAIAISIVGLLSTSFINNLVLDQPRRYILAIPLIFSFFAIFGLRVAFKLPTDTDANWPLRLTPPTIRQAVSVTRRLLLLGVLPVVAVWLLITLSLWPLADALNASAMLLVSAVTLTEAALMNWCRVPFAAAHEPTTSTLRRGGLYLLALQLYGFLLPAGQFELLRLPGGTLKYLLWMLVVLVVLRIKQELQIRRHQVVLTFDVVEPDSIEVLNLSEASS
jgi:hypothetical protein